MQLGVSVALYSCNLRARHDGGHSLNITLLLRCKTVSFKLGLARAHFAHDLWVQKLTGVSAGCGIALDKLLLHLKVAILEPEQWECTLRTTFVLKKVTICDPELRECIALLLYPKLMILQPELRQHSFRTIFLYLRIAILEPEPWECTSGTTFVLETSEF